MRHNLELSLLALACMSLFHEFELWQCERGWQWLTDGPDKDIKRPALDVCRTTEVDKLYVVLAVKDNVLIFDVSMHDEGFGV